jgi:alkylation response protein AidB-like acyl-CoA dehydrogenase
MAQVSIIETWDVSGLAGTGSHDVLLDQVFVPSTYTCAFKAGMTPQGTRYQSPVYRYVLYASFALPIGAVALGIAQGAVDACLELAQSKQSTAGREMLRDRSMFQVRVAEAVALVGSARAWLHTTVGAPRVIASRPKPGWKSGVKHSSRPPPVTWSSPCPRRCASSSVVSNKISTRSCAAPRPNPSSRSPQPP